MLIIAGQITGTLYYIGVIERQQGLYVIHLCVTVDDATPIRTNGWVHSIGSP